MLVFVTGANGFIGSAVVKELLSHGHQVLGLVRSESSKVAVEATGAKAWMGSLDDLEGLTKGAAQCDGVIHTAFIHDFSDYLGNCKKDLGVIDALAKGLLQKGPNLPLVVTSGTALTKPGVMGFESDPPIDAPRKSSEVAAHAAAAQGVKAMVIRLPPSVFGLGDKAFVPALINIAKDKNESAYVGAGANVWPSVHRLDAAALFRLALEKGSHGATYHGSADEGIPVKSIANSIGKYLNVPVVSKNEEQAPAHFGWLIKFVGLDNPVSSVQTQKELGWTPKFVGLLKALEDPGNKYFA